MAHVQGTVVGINVRTGMCMVAVDGGDLSVLELLGDEVELEDVLVGDLESHGRATLRNQTQRRDVAVFIEAIGCSLAAASELLRPR